MNIKKNDINSTRKVYVCQAGLQLISNFLILTFSFLLNIVVTKKVNPDSYGEYRYVVNYLLMVPGVIQLGYVNSAGRVAAISQENEQSKISGYAFTVSATLALVYVVISIPIIILMNINKVTNITWYAVYLSPFVILSTMQLAVNNILTGQNKIYSLSLFNLIPQSLFFLIVVIQIYIFNYTNALVLIIPYVIINGLSIIYRVYKCSPAKVKVFQSFIALKEENKRFGFKVYIGSIFGVVVGQVIGLISGSIIGMQNYGYFSLAFSFVVPFQMLAATFGTVLYRSNVTRKKISFQLFSFVIGFSLVSYLIFYILIDYLFIIIFSSEYIQAIPYMKGLALYGITLGLGDFINRFLGAKGYGRILMIGAILTGTVMVVISSFLIPQYGVNGLVYAYISSGTAYLLSMVIGYVYYLKNIQEIRNYEKNN